jgi:hypothetical protein
VNVVDPAEGAVQEPLDSVKGHLNVACSTLGGFAVAKADRVVEIALRAVKLWGRYTRTSVFSARRRDSVVYM